MIRIAPPIGKYSRTLVNTTMTYVDALLKPKPVFGRVEKEEKGSRRRGFIEENEILDCLVEGKVGRRKNVN